MCLLPPVLLGLGVGFVFCYGTLLMGPLSLIPLLVWLDHRVLARIAGRSYGTVLVCHCRYTREYLYE